VILWLGGELNFNAFISFLTTIVINNYASNCFSIQKPLDLCTIFLWFTSFLNLLSFPPLIMIHHLTFFIQISPFFEHNYFFSRIELQCTISISIVTLLIHANTMVSGFYFLRWSLSIIRCIFNVCNSSAIIYILSLFLRMIYFYSLDFYWSILILNGNILKVIHMYAMPYCSLYMTFNYFKSFFFIVEMKCKKLDITFAKYLKMWRPFFNQ